MSTSRKQVENHSHCPGKGILYSPEEMGQYVLERVFRYYYYGSVNDLPLFFRRFRQSEKNRYIQQTWTRTIDLHFFLKDLPFFYQEKENKLI